MELFHIALSIADRKYRPAAHAQPQQDRCEKGHQGIGRTYRRQCPGTNKPAYDQGICNIIKLLQHISADHRQGKKY